MAIIIGSNPPFEAAVAKFVGIDPAVVDPGSMQILLVNPDPDTDTMVRFTVVTYINTPLLKKVMMAALASAITDPNDPAPTVDPTSTV